jgi:hypothetical protein
MDMATWTRKFLEKYLFVKVRTALKKYLTKG